MQAAQNLFAGEQGVAYIPMPKGRGFTPRLVKMDIPGRHLGHGGPHPVHILEQHPFRDLHLEPVMGHAVPVQAVHNAGNQLLLRKLLHGEIDRNRPQVRRPPTP